MWMRHGTGGQQKAEGIQELLKEVWITDRTHMHTHFEHTPPVGRMYMQVTLMRRLHHPYVVHFFGESYCEADRQTDRQIDKDIFGKRKRQINRVINRRVGRGKQTDKTGRQESRL